MDQPCHDPSNPIATNESNIMRITGNIDHPSMKITVFRMDNRTSVKFENPLYEQTYKLGDHEQFATLEGVQKWATPELMEKVAGIFREMHRAALEATQQLQSNPASDIFEEII